MKKGKVIKKVIAMFICAIILLQPVYAAGTYKSREAIPEQYKWKLEDIYETESGWEQDVKLLEEELIPQLADYKSKLNNKQSVLSCLKADSETSKVLDKVYCYADLHLTLYGGSPEAQKRMGRANLLYQKYNEAASYISPELLKQSEDVLTDYMEDPDFKEYAQYFNKLIKNKPHVLPEKEEELLAQLAVFSQSPENIYSNFTNVDITFPSVKDSTGKDISVSEGNYGMLLENPDRDFRKSVYESVRATYMSFNNTFAAVLAAEVSKNVFFARAGNYDSALEASLSPDIPVSVYHNLISTANNGLAPLHKYIWLKKEALGIESVLGYDMQATIVSGQAKLLYSFEDAEKLIKDALKPLGEDYAAVLDTAFSENWIDVYETPGKQSGAFSAGVYGSHPFVLLNYSDSVYDVSVVAHELGHAVHQFYSSTTQPYEYSDVTIFNTEAASISNEIILSKYMIENAETNTEKLLYVNNLLDLYHTTFYSQTLMAEFEKVIHETAENGEALTAEAFNSIWSELISKYFGESYEVTELDAIGWSRIPHFYYNFYVYMYATSIAAANQITSGILDGKPGALDKYIEFLHSGTLYDPIETFANIGVDMRSPEVIEEFTKEFGYLVDEMERLMKLEGIIK